MAEEGIQFVDRSTLLRRFSGVVQAAREEIDAAIRDRRDYLVDKYGADPVKAFADADPLDLPHLAAEVIREALDRMQREVEAARQREEKARAEARMTERERTDLAVLRAANAEKRRKQKRRERGAKSRKGPGRGRQKRKEK